VEERTGKEGEGEQGQAPHRAQSPTPLEPLSQADTNITCSSVSPAEEEMSQTALREFSSSAWARVEERTGKEGEENRDKPRTVLSPPAPLEPLSRAGTSITL
jgi:hypothetical protein